MSRIPRAVGQLVLDADLDRLTVLGHPPCQVDERGDAAAPRPADPPVQCGDGFSSAGSAEGGCTAGRLDRQLPAAPHVPDRDRGAQQRDTCADPRQYERCVACLVRGRRTVGARRSDRVRRRTRVVTVRSPVVDRMELVPHPHIEGPIDGGGGIRLACLTSQHHHTAAVIGAYGRRAPLVAHRRDGAGENVRRGDRGAGAGGGCLRAETGPMPPSRPATIATVRVRESVMLFDVRLNPAVPPQRRTWVEGLRSGVSMVGYVTVLDPDRVGRR